MIVIEQQMSFTVDYTVGGPLLMLHHPLREIVC